MRPYNKDTDFAPLKAAAIELAKVNADSPKLGTAMMEQMLPPMRAVRFVHEAGASLGIDTYCSPFDMPDEWIEIFEACTAIYTGGKCGLDFAENINNIQPADVLFASLLNAGEPKAANDVRPGNAPGSTSIN